MFNNEIIKNNETFNSKMKNLMSNESVTCDIMSRLLYFHVNKDFKKTFEDLFTCGSVKIEEEYKNGVITYAPFDVESDFADYIIKNFSEYVNM